MNIRRKIDDWTPLSTLQGFVRLILLVDWDPIGVFGYAGAIDEYDSYAAEVCRLLRSGVSAEALAAHLNQIEKQNMGLRGERQDPAAVVEKLVRLYQTVLQNEQWSSENGSGDESLQSEI